MLFVPIPGGVASTLNHRLINAIPTGIKRQFVKTSIAKIRGSRREKCVFALPNAPQGRGKTQIRHRSPGILSIPTNSESALRRLSPQCRDLGAIGRQFRGNQCAIGFCQPLRFTAEMRCEFGVQRRRISAINSVDSIWLQIVPQTGTSQGGKRQTDDHTYENCPQRNHRQEPPAAEAVIDLSGESGRHIVQSRISAKPGFMAVCQNLWVNLVESLLERL